MANEITVSSRLRVVNGSLQFDTGNINLSLDQSAVGGPVPGYWIVGTTEESTTFPDLTTEGWLWMQNLDTANYVQWGFSTGVYGGRLKAGRFALIECEPGLTLYMKANTAACKVVVYCMEA